MKVIEIYHNVVLVTTPTQHEIAELFIRLQEFYESPYTNINSNYFTVDECKKTFINRTGSFSYFTDWIGFNVPGDSVCKFYEMFKHNLNSNERELLQRLLDVLDNTGTLPKNFYVIGISDAILNNDRSVLNHELSHAFYHTSPLYYKLMHVQMKLHILHNNGAFDKMKRTLRYNGYCDDVLDDEIQAYICTSSRLELFKMFGFWGTPWRYVSGMRQVFNQKINGYT